MVHKEHQSTNAMDYMESIDYIAYSDHAVDASDSRQDGPTVLSIAAARAAQQRERADFTQHTGILLDRDGRLLPRFRHI